MLSKVGTALISTGKINRGRLQVGIYPDGRRAYIPVITIKGKKSGSTLALITGAHGNELNGPEVVGRFLARLNIDKLRGTIIILPLMNPWGFKLRERYVLVDGRDLNRSFPGHAGGSFSQRVAYEIMRQVITPSDLVVDVHDAGTRRVLLPHAIAHSQPATDPTRTLALACGFDAIVLRKAKPGMLAGVARQKMNKAAITLEIGGAMRFWNPFIERAVEGLLNILKYQDMLPGARTLPAIQLLLKRKSENPAEADGLLTSWVNIGDFVNAGQPLYRIYNPLNGKIITHRARYCGIVIAKPVLAHVSKGQTGLSIVKFAACGRDIFSIKSKVIKNKSSYGVHVRESILSKKHQSTKKGFSAL